MIISHRSKFVSDDWMIDHGFMEPPPADHTYTHTYMHIHMYIHAYMHLYVYTYIHMIHTYNTHTSMHTYIFYVRMYIHLYVHTSVCTHIQYILLYRWWDKPVSELKLQPFKISTATSCSQAISYMKENSLLQVTVVSDEG